MSDNNQYTHDSFNLYQAYSYTLILKIEATTFSFAVVHENRLLVSAQNCDLTELADPNQFSDFLTAAYRQVIIGLPATGLTLIPKSLFSDDRVPAFARFLDVKPEETVFAQAFDDQNAIVFKTDGKLVSQVEKYGLQNVMHTARGWVTTIAKSNPPSNDLYLEVGTDTIQFCYFTLNSLRFYNSFEFKGEDELAYFTSFVIGELGLKAQYITLVVSGNVTEGDKYMSRLANFYPKIVLITLSAIELPLHFAAHQFLALGALSTCGSLEAV